MPRYRLLIPIDVAIHFDAIDDKAAEAIVESLDVQFTPGIAHPEWNEIGGDDATAQIAGEAKSKKVPSTLSGVLDTVPLDPEIEKLMRELEELEKQKARQ